MSWARVKKVFKKKRKRKDQVISFDGGIVGLKDVTPLPDRQEPKKPKGEQE